MKGSIACCLRDLVIEKFGDDKWKKSLVEAGLGEKHSFFSLQDVEDATMMKVIQAVCKVTGVTEAQAADAFGDYWVNVYAKKYYQIYYSNKNDAKSFLLSMDDVHIRITKSIENAQPPPL